MDEQQQELAAFERGFAEASGLEPPAPAAPVAEAPQEPEAQPEPTEPAQEQAGETTNAAEATAGEETPAELPAAEEDPEVFEGFKRSELKRLVESASEVESLKLRLRKAEGKVGELNGRLNEAQKPAQLPSTQPQQATQPVELPEDIKQFERDYPDVYRSVHALIQMQQPQPPAAPPAAPQEPVATGNAVAQAEPDPLVVEGLVMDRMHQGWREKVQSQTFGSWLASQGDEVKQAYHGAQTAQELSAVIGSFDQWSAARQGQAEKAAKGQQRLQRAVTPTGAAPRPQAAPTEQEAMEAAFKRVMGQ